MYNKEGLFIIGGVKNGNIYVFSVVMYVNFLFV